MPRKSATKPITRRAPGAARTGAAAPHTLFPDTDTERTLRRLRELCLAFPESSERSSWGHPNFRAGTKTFAAFERVKSRPSVAFRLDPTDVDLLLRREGFFATPYGRGLWVSLWADGPVDWKLVERLLERSYRLVALKRMVAALDGGVS
jgi:predicted DNA-binding protein (MmcQ/YjbR family)